ncbi:MAG: ribosome maturation factor RimM [Gemmatimonadetes bacterium]|nr:ribosome maturation factor RimM [Gemmatimonadota bacterium]
MSAPSAAYALVGRIAKAHGIRGEVAVHAVTDRPEAFFASGRVLFAGDARGNPLASKAGPATLTITAVRAHQDALLVTFDAIPDRTAAEQWRGRTLLVSADELGEPDAVEVYLHELAGMHAEDERGNPLGEVTDWYEVPQGILLGLVKDGHETLVPFVDEIVRDIDREARRLVLRLPDGLGA